MHAAIVGAGPTGLYLGISLARRGHAVTVVDRDGGPAQDGTWQRQGVMQFHHPHGFRGQVVDALLAEMPEVVDALVAAGAETITWPDRPEVVVGIRCRRSTFERVLRAAAVDQAGLTFRTGHAEKVCSERGHAVGLLVNGRRLDADLVLDASGRSGRLSKGLRSAARGGDCGTAYVSRQHELLPGADRGPVNDLLGMVGNFAGYQVIVFLLDNRTISTLIVRLADDIDLAELRHQSAYEAACRAIPGLSDWTDPARTRPITPVLPGGRLANVYQGQRNDSGRVPVDGLIFVGDAVCTTNPSAGRGVALSLMQARRLLELLDEHPLDYSSCSLAFEEWCDDQIEPWFADHVAWDADQVRRWTGGDVDLSRRLPSDLIMAATEVDPTMMRVVGPYLGMLALPDTLLSVEPRAKEIYADGWRPPVPVGPTRDDLADLVRSVSRRQPVAAGSTTVS